MVKLEELTNLMEVELVQIDSRWLEKVFLEITNLTSAILDKNREADMGMESIVLYMLQDILDAQKQVDLVLLKDTVKYGLLPFAREVLDEGEIK